MDPITTILLVLRGALDLANSASTLLQSHNAGKTITEEEAAALREQAKALMTKADQDADNA